MVFLGTEAADVLMAVTDNLSMNSIIFHEYCSPLAKTRTFVLGHRYSNGFKSCGFRCSNRVNSELRARRFH